LPGSLCVFRGAKGMVATLADIVRLAQESFDKAMEAADEIRLARVVEFAESLKFARAKSLRLRTGARLLADEPEYEDLETYRGLKAWGAMMAFELRKSSDLAAALSPRDMYIVMHTYLPTIIAVVESYRGLLVGLRGDGAIACFGLVDQGEGEPKVTSEQSDAAMRLACNCGHAIVKAMTLAVNPVLAKGDIRKGKHRVGVGEGRLLVGVGIDVGDIVATKIGLGEAHELTAYGTAVNFCCKRSFGNDMVILTKRAKDMFPKSKGGRTRFPPYTDVKDAYILRYPDDYVTLA
jgi:class 3 adenylate cyclase